ncbi:MAG: hypothetical protein L6R40_003369 [Gallowayella cf. fulva]|nr:MAG: hypothetical protein L6R40_003369 [Xanthomendoza cf. fulva]
MGSMPGKTEEGEEEEEYQLPDLYQHLDELNAPSPIPSPHAERPQGYLEDHRSSIAQTPHHHSRDESYNQRDRISKHREAPSPATSDYIPTKKTPATRHPRASRFATELFTISYLIFFSIFGTLARLGLQALTFYPSAPVATGVLWPNVAGTFLIGFLSEDRKLFSTPDWTCRPPSAPLTSTHSAHPHNHAQNQNLEAQEKQHASVKRTIPLYIGLTTGFCGSLTSFSSFIRDAFLALSNTLPVPISHTTSSSSSSSSSNIVHRNGGYSFLALLAVIITTIALCFSALLVGAQLAVAVERYTPSITYIFARRFVDRIMLILAWGCWIGAIFMAIWPPDRTGGPATNTRNGEYWRGTAIFAIVFAPLGCLSRFYLSLALNAKIASFPMGTFTINMLGTAAEGLFWDLQHSSHAVGGGLVGCQVLQGMMDGFCGAATTVSTWVGELKALRRGHAWVYGGVSVVVGVGIMGGVMGGVLWGRGWDGVVCGMR